MLSLAALVLSLPAFAAPDAAVAVIHRPGTVIGQVNEEKPATRLPALFRWAGAGNTLELTPAGGPFRLRCARNEEAATCTFRFLEGNGVEIFSRGAEVTLPGVGNPAEALALRFVGGNGDELSFRTEAGALTIRAAKRR